MDGSNDLLEEMAKITGRKPVVKLPPARNPFDVDSLLDEVQGALSSQESSGNTRAVNPRTNATGEFQVLPSNIPSWTKTYLGQSLTPEQFKANPEAQRKVFRGEFGKYLGKALPLANGDKDKAIRMAAAAWYGGEGAMNRFDDPNRFRPDEPSFREYTNSVLNKVRKSPKPFDTSEADNLLAEMKKFTGGTANAVTPNADSLLSEMRAITGNVTPQTDQNAQLEAYSKSGSQLPFADWQKTQSQIIAPTVEQIQPEIAPTVETQPIYDKTGNLVSAIGGEETPTVDVPTDLIPPSPHEQVHDLADIKPKRIPNLTKKPIAQKNVPTESLTTTGKIKVGDTILTQADDSDLPDGQTRVRDEDGETYIIDTGKKEIKDESLKEVAERIPVRLAPYNERSTFPPELAKRMQAEEIAASLAAKYDISQRDAAEYILQRGFTDINTGKPLPEERLYTNPLAGRKSSLNRQPEGGEFDTYNLARRDLRDLILFSRENQKKREDYVLDQIAKGVTFDAEQLKELGVDLNKLQQGRYDDYQMSLVKGKVAAEDFEKFKTQDFIRSQDDKIAAINAAARVGQIDRKTADLMIADRKQEVEAERKLRAEYNPFEPKLKEMSPATSTGQSSSSYVRAEQEQTDAYLARMKAKYGSFGNVFKQREAEEKAEAERKQRIANMGYGEYLDESVKSIVRGVGKSFVTNLVSNSLRGGAVWTKPVADYLSTLFGVEGTTNLKTEDHLLYKAADYLDRDMAERFTTNKDLDQEFIQGKVPNALGSSLAFIFPSLANKPRAAIALYSTLGMGGASYEEAKKAGASEADAQKFALLNSGLFGWTEIVGLNKALIRLNTGKGGTVWQKFFREAMTNVSKEVPEEVLLNELPQTVGDNILAQITYDPDRKFDKDLYENLLVAGFTAKAASTGVTLINTIKNERAIKAQTDATTETPLSESKLEQQTNNQPRPESDFNKRRAVIEDGQGNIELKTIETKLPDKILANFEAKLADLQSQTPSVARDNQIAQVEKKIARRKAILEAETPEIETPAGTTPTPDEARGLEIVQSLDPQNTAPTFKALTAEGFSPVEAGELIQKELDAKTKQEPTSVETKADVLPSVAQGEVPKVESAKQPFEITKDEFRLATAARLEIENKAKHQTTIDNLRSESTNQAQRINEILHKRAIESALKEGKTIPPNVLTDYPDLAAKYGKGEKVGAEKTVNETKPEQEPTSVETKADVLPSVAQSEVPKVTTVERKDTIVEKPIEEVTKEKYESLPQQKEQVKEPEKPKAKVIELERPDLAKQLNVFTERGTKASIVPKVVDSSDLLTSLDEGYPSEFQPRDRSRQASKAQIAEIANKINPEFLGDSPKASDGRPLVVPVELNGQTKYAVISGNGRTQGIREAYQLGKADDYKNFANSKEKTDTKQPVYVGILDPKEVSNLAEFAKEANESATAQMSSTEQAKADADRLDSNVMSQFVASDDGTIHGAANRDFIRAFMAKAVGTAEQNRFLTSDGTLNQDGVNRVRNAIFAKAFGESEAGLNAIARMSESTDNNVKNITSALLAKAPQIAELKELVKSGNRYKEINIAGDLAKAMEKYSALRDSGTSVDDYIQQGTLFGAETTPFQTRIMQVFDTHKRSPKAIRGIIDNFLAAGEAFGNPNQINLFGESEPISVESIFEGAVKAYERGITTEPQTVGLFDQDKGRKEQSETRQESDAVTPKTSQEKSQLSPTERASLRRQKDVTEEELSKHNIRPLSEKGQFGQISHKLRRAMEGDSDLLPELVKIFEPDVEIGDKNASNAVLDKIADTVGKDRSSQLSPSDWQKILETNNLSDSAIDTINDALTHQEQWNRDLTSFIESPELIKATDRMAEEVDLENLEKYTDIPYDIRKAVLAAGRKYAKLSEPTIRETFFKGLKAALAEKSERRASSAFTEKGQGEKEDKGEEVQFTKSGEISPREKIDVTPPYTITALMDEKLAGKRGRDVKLVTIKQILKQPNTKQIEKDIIAEVLEMPAFAGKEQFSYDEFEQAVKFKLMPLKVIESSSYADYGSENVGVDVDESVTNIYNSQLEHGQTGHFKSAYSDARIKPDYEIREVVNPNNNKTIYVAVPVGVELTEANIAENVGTATRSKEKAEEWLKLYNKQTSVNKGLFGHTRVWTSGSDSYGVEFQSDAYQKKQAEELVIDSYINKYLNDSLPKSSSVYEKIEDLNNVREQIKNTPIEVRNKYDFVNRTLPEQNASIKATEQLLTELENLKPLVKETNELFNNTEVELKRDKSDAYTERYLTDQYGVNVEILKDRYGQFSVFYKTDKGDTSSSGFPNLEQAKNAAENVVKKYRVEKLLREKLPQLDDELPAPFKHSDASGVRMGAYKYRDVILNFLPRNRMLLDGEAFKPIPEYESGLKQVQEEIEQLRWSINRTLEGTDTADYRQYYESKKTEQKITKQLLQSLPIQDKQFIAHRKNYTTRLLREEIRKQAAQGQERFLIPTPRTLALIEGYISDEGSMPYEITSGDTDGGDLQVGDTIDYAGYEYTVIESGYDYIRVVESDKLRQASEDALIDDEVQWRLDDAKSTLEKYDGDTISADDLDSLIQEAGIYDHNITDAEDYFDVDDEGNFVFDFGRIESEVEDAIRNIARNEDYEYRMRDDFGYSNVFRDGNTIYWTEERVGTEQFGQPSEYESKSADLESFDIDEMSETEQTVLRKYEELNELFKKERPDVQTVTDDKGNEWLATDLTDMDKSREVILFNKAFKLQDKRLGTILNHLYKKDVKELAEKSTAEFDPVRNIAKLSLEAAAILRKAVTKLRGKDSGAFYGFYGAPNFTESLKVALGNLNATHRAKNDFRSVKAIREIERVIGEASKNDFHDLVVVVHHPAFPLVEKFATQEEQSHRADYRIRNFERKELQPYLELDGYRKAVENLKGKGYKDASPNELHNEVVAKSFRSDAEQQLGISREQVKEIRKTYRKQLIESGVTAEDFQKEFNNISKTAETNIKEYEREFIRKRQGDYGENVPERSESSSSANESLRETRREGRRFSNRLADGQSRNDRSGVLERVGKTTDLAEKLNQVPIAQDEILFSKAEQAEENLPDDSSAEDIATATESNIKKVLSYIYDGKRDVSVPEAVMNVIRTGYLGGVSVIKTNLQGNTANIAAEQLIKPAAAILDILNARYNPKAKGQRYVPGLSVKNILTGFFGERGLFRSGLFNTEAITKKGTVRERLKRLKEGDSMLAALAGGVGKAEASKFDLNIQRGNPNFVRNTGVPALDAIIEAVKRVVVGVDRPFKAFVRSAETRGMARIEARNEARKAALEAKKNTAKSDFDWKKRMRELQKDPSPLMRDMVERYADTVTFQNDNAVTDLYDKARRLLIDDKALSKFATTETQKRVAKYVGGAAYVSLGSSAPFVKTPANIGFRTLEYFFPTGVVAAAWKFHRIGQTLERNHFIEDTANKRAKYIKRLAGVRGKVDSAFNKETEKIEEGFERRRKTKENEFKQLIEDTKKSTVLTESAKSERIANINEQRDKWLEAWQTKKDNYTESRETEMAEITRKRKAKDGLLKKEWEADDLYADMKFTAFENRAFIETAARAGVGGTVGGLMLLGVLAGLIEAVGTTDYDEERNKAKNKKEAGIADNSVVVARTGKNTAYRVPYDKYPLGNSVKMGINLLEQYQRPGDWDDRFGAMFGRFGKDVKSTNPLTADEFEKDDFMSWAGSKANSVTPVLNLKILQELGEVLDEKPRKYWDEGFGAQYLIKLPPISPYIYSRENLPESENYLGGEKGRGNAWRRLIRMFDPLQVSEEFAPQSTLKPTPVTKKKKEDAPEETVEGKELKLKKSKNK